MRRQAVLVLRATNIQGGVTEKIWKSETAYDVIQLSHRWLRKHGKLRLTCVWTPERDAFVIERYRHMSKTMIAQLLSDKWGGMYTKNAVISRYNSILKGAA